MKRIEKIRLDRSAEDVDRDLERYVEKALELGASRATQVSCSEIPVDERVTLKCQIPRCFGYGVCAHCPPNTLKPSELASQLRAYRRAVFFVKDVPSEVIVRNKATIQERIDVYRQLYEIVNQIESMAFYDGHYLAFGLAAGSCRHSYCSQAKDCAALQGERCRFSLKSRPSMEAVGVDVFRMAATAGWDIYPIGSDAQPDDVPKGTLAGLVVVC